MCLTPVCQCVRVTGSVSVPAWYTLLECQCVRVTLVLVWMRVLVCQCVRLCWSASYTNGCCRLLSHLPDLHLDLPANRKNEGLEWWWLSPFKWLAPPLKWWWSIVLTLVTLSKRLFMELALFILMLTISIEPPQLHNHQLNLSVCWAHTGERQSLETQSVALWWKVTSDLSACLHYHHLTVFPHLLKVGATKIKSRVRNFCPAVLFSMPWLLQMGPALANAMFSLEFDLWV